MRDYLTQVERRPDGSLRTVLYCSGRQVYQEPARNLRHGKRRAHDLLCSAIHEAMEADPASGVDCRGGIQADGDSTHALTAARNSRHAKGFVR